MIRQSVLRLALAALLASPTYASAQQRREARNAVVIASGITALPDALSSQCGNRANGGGGGGPDVGASLQLHLRHLLVAQLDTRLVSQLSSNCELLGVPVDTQYARSLYHNPLATSAVRLGIETPPGLPLFRISAGAGVAWGGQPLPLGVVTLTWSTRGRGVRFLVEAERDQTRMRANEVHHDWTGQQADISKRIVLYPVAHAVRVGLEWPLRSGSRGS